MADPTLPPPPPLRAYLPTMLASTAAGIIARTATHPIDTCKARLQVQQGSKRPSIPARAPQAGAAASAANTTISKQQSRGLWGTFSRVWTEQGMRGLYRGYAFAATGSAPASVLYFTSYELTRDSLLGHSHWARENAFACHFTAGLVAEAISCVVWVPVDVIKERMQVQQRGSKFYYVNSRDAVRTVLRTEGVEGLYRAYGATVLSFGPFSALYFMFYEQLKGLAFTHVQDTETESRHRRAGTGNADDVNDDTDAVVPLWMLLMSGASAGAAASFLTNPLDLVKLRLQVQRSGGGSPCQFNFGYKNLLHGLRIVIREEGPLALMRGVGARMAFHAPSTAVYIGTFEYLKRWFTQELN